MILEVAGILTLAGFLTWVIGAFFEYPEISVIGGTIIVAVGAMIVLTGLSYSAGASSVSNTTTVEETVASETIESADEIANISVSSQEDTPTGLRFSEDGQRMFVVGIGSDSVHQYSTTDFDITLATHQREFDVSSQTSTPAGVTFGDGGTRMYVPGYISDDVYEYQLSEAYNVSTASLSSTLNVGTDTDGPRAVAFDKNGDTMYVAGADASEIVEYDLSTSWSVSSASVVSQFDVSAQETDPAGLAFDDDGRRMVLVGEGSNEVYEYELSTSFDLSSASYEGESLDVSSWATLASGVDFEDNEMKMFVSDRDSAEIHQFDVTTTATRETTTKTVEETYNDVPLPQQFPGGVLVMVVGGLLATRQMGEDGGIM